MSFQLFDISTNVVTEGTEDRACLICGKDQSHELSVKTTVVRVAMIPVSTKTKPILKCQQCNTKS